MYWTITVKLPDLVQIQHDTTRKMYHTFISLEHLLEIYMYLRVHCM